ncbi:glycoside hydrolase superfamily [Chytridium lagenaria]|nr:glycoside hydrolase superfamily [Chytridium lagenaria]
MPSYNSLMTWDDAISKARTLVSSLSLQEKIDLGSGVGWTGNIKPIAHIGFRGLCLQDSPAGIRFALNVSAFPASINVAATFDKNLMYLNGLYMGEEARMKGVNVLLAPMTNMHRNEQEHDRDGGNSIMDRRTLQEIYVRPFKHAIKAGVASVMCSYNRFNGVYACENPELMSILKNELHFDGFVMSDWWASHSSEEAATAGLDMVMPGTTSLEEPDKFWWGTNITASVIGNKVPLKRIDDIATRVLSAWLKLSQDKDFPDTNFDSFRPSPSQLNVQGNHRQHIREVGAASTVLLKNLYGTLPLSRAKYKRVAILGSDAFTPKEPLNHDSDHGAVPTGTLAQGWGSGTANFPYLISPIEGMTTPAIQHGIELSPLNENYDMNAVSRVARILTSPYYITVDGNVGDRNNLSLWNNGEALILASARVRRTVGCCSFTRRRGYDGMAGSSECNSGRWKVTFYGGRNRADYAADVIYEKGREVVYGEGMYFDYRWNDKNNITPLFPFGYGLSYTTFTYSNLRITPSLPLPPSLASPSPSPTPVPFPVVKLSKSTLDILSTLICRFGSLKGLNGRRLFLVGGSLEVVVEVSRDAIEVWRDGWEVPKGGLRCLWGRRVGICGLLGRLRIMSMFTITDEAVAFEAIVFYRC